MDILDKVIAWQDRMILHLEKERDTLDQVIKTLMELDERIKIKDSVIDNNLERFKE
jgi:hypothetical protein